MGIVPAPHTSRNSVGLAAKSRFLVTRDRGGEADSNPGSSAALFPNQNGSTD